jgi:phosphopantothenoylcysteine decarboxylase/phosphopantothenate--cysteine ligase
MSLRDKHILLGVTGGIAAYKSADLSRRLRAEGAVVKVTMTKAATEFVSPLTYQALSGQPVHTALLDSRAEAAMGHIELARWADVVMIAPASANFMAKLAHGLADDLLSTLCLATAAPIILAPAMNRLMWMNRATQENVMILKNRGFKLLGPDEGSQACGEIGPGRMLEPEALVAGLAECFNRSNQGGLQGLDVLLTAGPTREVIDPVRYISNRSSGRMGFALAQAAVEAGARVSLIVGPTALPTPASVRRIDVESAAEMHAAVMREVADHQIFIACAAVADYRPAAVASQKIKKTQAQFKLELVRTPDIVAAVAALDSRPFILGFAAETEALEQHARAKLERKSLDMIAANRVDLADSGFVSEYNALEVFWQNGHQTLGRARKTELAQQLIKLVVERYAAKNPITQLR